MGRTDPDASTVQRVRHRDEWRCARCAGWGPLSTQHRVARSMGGTSWPRINDPEVLLTLCGDGTRMCHGWVEAHPRWSTLHGWSVSVHRRESVADVPVWTWRGWVLLGARGGVTLLADHPGVPGCACGCVPVETPTDLWASPLVPTA